MGHHAPDTRRGLGSEERSPLCEELSTIVRSRFAGRLLRGRNDPGTCLLVPLWTRALKVVRVDMACCLVIRNQLKVARSFEWRDGFSPPKSEGLWLHHTFAALRVAWRTPTVVISHGTLLEHGEAEVRRCCYKLGLPWRMAAEEVVIGR